MLKISIITAVLNRQISIAKAIQSVNSQTYAAEFIENIIIDGLSTDSTLSILSNILRKNSLLISEGDQGIYYALNKGLILATGYIIGIMHSDDFYSDNNVISDVASIFGDPSVDIVYGDLDYVDKENTQKVIRHWSAGEFRARNLSYGWMPPHPTIFIRRKLLAHLGNFDTRYKISADYDFILRYFLEIGMGIVYLPRVIVKMRIGGESNRNIGKIFIKMKEDYLILRENKVGGVVALTCKNLSKLKQFMA